MGHLQRFIAVGILELTTLYKEYLLSPDNALSDIHISGGTSAIHSTCVPANDVPAQGKVQAALQFVPVRPFLWAVGFLCALWAFLQLGAGVGVHNDFTQNVWLPARLLMEGADPYNPTAAQTATALGPYSAQFTGFNSGHSFYSIYPIWVALLLSPFATMPLIIATAVWRAADLLLLMWSVGSLLRSTNPVFASGKAVAVMALSVILFLSFFYRATILTFYVGQFAIFELALLAAIWSWLLSSPGKSWRKLMLGDVLAGLALAILATKPQAVGLPVLLLVLWAVSRRRWTVPLSAAISGCLLLFGPLLFYPGSLSGWLSTVFGAHAQASSQAYVSASVWGVSYQLLGKHGPWVAAATLLSVAGVLALLPSWWRDLKDRTAPIPLSLPLTVCVNSVISPYMLGYEHVLLLFPALVLLATAGLPVSQVGSSKEAKGRARWRQSIYIWLAVLPLLVGAVQGTVDKEFPAILQSLPMLALCCVASLRWRKRLAEETGTLGARMNSESSEHLLYGTTRVGA
ncbi:MAG: DUF2029 domain-containing protein [Chloroflexota bacterium]|nr:DUF2029 domain-containing protein [Chloroflexota bacterium]